MIRIVITAEAYQAILAGRSPDSVQALAEARERLKAARAPSESYSDAIVRLAAQ